MALLASTIVYLRRYIDDIPLGGGTLTYQEIVEVFPISAPTTDLTLSQLPNDTEPVMVFYNGLLQLLTTDYTQTGTAVHFLFSMDSGDAVQVKYWEIT